MNGGSFLCLSKTILMKSEGYVTCEARENQAVIIFSIVTISNDMDDLYSFRSSSNFFVFVLIVIVVKVVTSTGL